MITGTYNGTKEELIDLLEKNKQEIVTALKNYQINSDSNEIAHICERSLEQMQDQRNKFEKMQAPRKEIRKFQSKISEMADAIRKFRWNENPEALETQCEKIVQDYDSLLQHIYKS